MGPGARVVLVPEHVVVRNACKMPFDTTVLEPTVKVPVSEQVLEFDCAAAAIRGRK